MMLECLMNDFTERLEALETRIAYQDQTIEELNTTITAQWRQIDLLTRKLEQMEEQVRSGVHIADPSTEPPPPHY
jgi:SlyX protein